MCIQKKFLVLMSTILLLFAIVFSIQPVFAASNELTIQAKKSGSVVTSVQPGDSFDVEIGFAEKFNIFDMNFTYDTDLFELVAEDCGVSGVTNKTIPGIYYFNFSVATIGGVNAKDDKLVTLTFEVKSAATPGDVGLFALNFDTPLKRNISATEKENLDVTVKNDLESGLTIGQKSVIGISVNKAPDQTEYVQGSEAALDLTGGTIDVLYDDDSKEVVAMTDDSVVVTGFDATVAGKNTLTVSYENGGKTWTTTFDVTIKAKSVDPAPTPKKKSDESGSSGTQTKTVNTGVEGNDTVMLIVLCSVILVLGGAAVIFLKNRSKS